MFEMINGSKLAFADNRICVLFAYDVQIYTGSRKSRGSEIIRRGIAASVAAVSYYRSGHDHG